MFAFLSGLGARLLSDEVKALARRARIDLGEKHPVDPYGLTDREREVLRGVARGLTNRQLAGELYISEKTASVHVSNILRKLTAANRGEAAARAISEGLVEVGDLSRGN
jgi:DNA-binding NarL/FixJ family response regulator